MMIHVARKPIVFVVAAVLFFTFCAAPSAHAAVILIAPVVGFAIWGIVTAIMGAAAGIDTARDGRPDREAKVKADALDRKNEDEAGRWKPEFQPDAG